MLVSRMLVLAVFLVSVAHGAPLSAPLDRFGSPLDAIEQTLTSSTDDAVVIANLLQRDTRKDLFRLEGLIRLYVDTFGKNFEKQAKAVHELSHRLGNYSDRVAAVKLAKEVGAPADLVTYLEGKRREEQAAFAQYLHQNWLAPAPALAKLQATLAHADWKGQFRDYDADRDNALREVGHELKKMGERTFDLNVLEGDDGIHKLRRQLRWFTITTGALQGMITLTDEKGCPVGQYRGLLADAKLVASPYAQLPTSETEIACAIPRCLYLAMVQAVDELGTAKDIGQYQDFLAEGALGSGLAPTKARAEQLAAAWVRQADIARKHPGFLDFRAKAKAIYHALVEADLLSVLHQTLKACRAD